jgi:thioredoxin 1
MLKTTCAIMIIFSMGLNYLLLGEPNKERKKPDIIYFGATWCEPCKKMKTIFKDPQVKKELQKFNFKIVDIDESPELKTKYKIRVVPTTVIKNSNKITKYEGYMTKSKLLRLLSNITP